LLRAVAKRQLDSPDSPEQIRDDRESAPPHLLEQKRRSATLDYAAMNLG